MSVIDHIRNDGERAIVEAYAQLMNAEPIAIIVDQNGWHLGTVDGNFNFKPGSMFTTRTAAVTAFAEQLHQWVARA